MAILVFIICYLIGSIPFGLVIAKFNKIDIRKHGSGNIGATNIARVLGKKMAILTFLLDGLKGLVPVIIVSNIMPEYIYYAGLGAIVGHIFSIYLKFKGGKGVSTTILTLFAIDKMIAIAICLIWLSVFVTTRYSSLSAIISISIGFIIAMMTLDFKLISFFFIIYVIIIYKHRHNIQRLMKKEENKF